MFTGLVEDIGAIRSIERGSRQLRLCVRCSIAATEFVLGESIAVNGICLTVVEYGEGWFKADLSPETWRVTALGALREGSRVNLERALRLGDRLGGHLVSGHVDATASVRRIMRDANAVVFRFELEPQALRYLVAKGSVTLDGVSLTVAQLFEDGFSVMIIPHTLEQTALQYLKARDRVNVETDLIGKYVERLLGIAPGASPCGSGLSLELLARNGFL